MQLGDGVRPSAADDHTPEGRTLKQFCNNFAVPEKNPATLVMNVRTLSSYRIAVLHVCVRGASWSGASDKNEFCGALPTGTRCGTDRCCSDPSLQSAAHSQRRGRRKGRAYTVASSAVATKTNLGEGPCVVAEPDDRLPVLEVPREREVDLVQLIPYHDTWSPTSCATLTVVRSRIRESPPACV
jgi:hypothetical protein